MARAKTASGDDIREELVLDAGNLVLEVELLLLEPLELKRVGAACFLERIDGAVEVTVLLLKPKQGRPELANLLALHRTSPAPCCLWDRESIATNRRWRKALGKNLRATSRVVALHRVTA